jgi:DNA-binding ferritin-like protein
VGDQESYSALREKLRQATRLMDATDDPMTKDRLAEMVRELERLVEIAADRENLNDAD